MEDSATLPDTRFKRVLLKISGEALMGDQHFGIDADTIRYVAEEQRKRGRIPEIPQGIFVFWHQRMLTFAGVFGWLVIPTSSGCGKLQGPLANLPRHRELWRSRR